MIYINNQWEEVLDLRDIFRVIQEHIGTEFARAAEEIIEAEIESKLTDIREQFEDLTDAYSEVENVLKELENTICGAKLKMKKTGFDVGILRR